MRLQRKGQQCSCEEGSACGQACAFAVDLALVLGISEKGRGQPWGRGRNLLTTPAGGSTLLPSKDERSVEGPRRVQSEADGTGRFGTGDPGCPCQERSLHPLRPNRNDPLGGRDGAAGKEGPSCRTREGPAERSGNRTDTGRPPGACRRKPEGYWGPSAFFPDVQRRPSRLRGPPTVVCRRRTSSALRAGAASGVPTLVSRFLTLRCNAGRRASVVLQPSCAGAAPHPPFGRLQRHGS